MDVSSGAIGTKPRTISVMQTNTFRSLSTFEIFLAVLIKVKEAIELQISPHIYKIPWCSLRKGNDHIPDIDGETITGCFK